MNKLILLVIAFYTLSGFEHGCYIHRPAWQTRQIKLAGKNIQVSTREYILITKCHDVKLNHKNKIIKDKTLCYDEYNKQEYTANQIDIDHILPWSFIKKNSKDCNNILEKYNDLDNLALVNRYDNRLKSNKIGKILGFNDITNNTICSKQLEICKKQKLINCKQIVDNCNLLAMLHLNDHNELLA